MSKDIKLSIIVPVYNVERCIERNVLSIKEVVSDQIEVIYVDDGSTDSSYVLLEKYTSGIDGIKIYRKSNEGPGAARNYGIDRANGEYIFFLDSDDYIDGDDLFNLIDIAKNNNLEVLEFCYRLVNESGKELLKPNFSDESVVNRIMEGSNWLRTEKCCSLQVAYLYKREFIIKNNLRMPEGVIHEDVEYVTKCMWYAKKFMKVNVCIYNYVMRTDSIMHTKGKQHGIDSHEAIYRTIEFAQNEVDADTYKEYFEPYIIACFYEYCHVLIQNGENIRKALNMDELFRQDILKWLNKSVLLTRKIQYFCIKYKLYELYTLVYKIYNCIRPNYLSSK